MTCLAQAPLTDRRATEIRHLDLDYTKQLPNYTSKEAWLARAQQLKLQILTSAGLWPTPVKTPLKATIFSQIDRGNYTIEKVYFESYPGHFVSGNLYRPKGVSGKVPAVLLPHGHWAYGRLENTPVNSGPARAIGFAQQGYVAFTWDMVGYNDNIALSHQFAIGHREGTSREVLWGINLLGLQLWNSIRAIDFLQSLPDVDPEKIGCTGESGGGTQTFLLAAVDERIKVAAPVNMISTIMQGGSLCENAPNLRIDTNNVELAALFAPRPMLMVSATGDWTKNTLKVEFPAVQKIYQLFDAPERVTAVQMNAPHNYNQESREAVYGWFAHWLKGRPETTPIKERGISIPPLSELLVFFSRQRPAGELNAEQFTAARIQANQQQLAIATPANQAGLAKFQQQWGESFKAALLAAYPAAKELTVLNRQAINPTTETIELTRQTVDDRVKLTIHNPPNAARAQGTVILVAPPDKAADAVIDALLKASKQVVQVEVFKGFSNPAEVAKYKFITTYNRTSAANRIQDILTACAFVQQTLLKQPLESQQVTLVGLGEAGLWTLLARGLLPQIGQTIVDADQFATASDDSFLQKLPIPGLRRAGDFVTAVTLAPTTPLFIYNTGNQFQTQALLDVYGRLGRAENLRTQSQPLTPSGLIALLNAK